MMMPITSIPARFNRFPQCFDNTHKIKAKKIIAKAAQACFLVSLTISPLYENARSHEKRIKEKGQAFVPYSFDNRTLISCHMPCPFLPGIICAASSMMSFPLSMIFLLVSGSSWGSRIIPAAMPSSPPATKVRMLLLIETHPSYSSLLKNMFFIPRLPDTMFSACSIVITKKSLSFC